MHWRKLLAIAMSIVAITALAATTVAADAHQDGFVPLRVKGAQHNNRPLRSSNIYSHGGAVQTATRLYISWWGPEWSTGFSTGGYTSASAQNYTTAFFTSVGGSSWLNTDTQYCQNVPNGTYFCSTASAPVYITNPATQYGGSLNDTTPVPSSPTQTDIANAAIRLMQHFGYSNQATYAVFTPSGKSMNGFGTQWCAWHSSTSSSAGTLAYAYVPYQPDAGASCGMNFVNTSNDSFGNGYFDGFSIVAGHEFEEAQTDPFPNGGWQDRNGSENADKCAWNSLSSNITLAGNQFAVQPLWSNAYNSSKGGCVMSYP